MCTYFGGKSAHLRLRIPTLPAEGTECIWPDNVVRVCASRSRGLARSTLVLGGFSGWVWESRSVSDADAGGTVTEGESTGVHTEQATNSAGLWSGAGMLCRERRKPGRASSDARVPHGVTHFDPHGGS